MFFFDSLENGTKFTKNVKRARRIGTRSKFPVVLRYFSNCKTTTLYLVRDLVQCGLDYSL